MICSVKKKYTRLTGKSVFNIFEYLSYQHKGTKKKNDNIFNNCCYRHVIINCNVNYLNNLKTKQVRSSNKKYILSLMKYYVLLLIAFHLTHQQFLNKTNMNTNCSFESFFICFVLRTVASITSTNIFVHYTKISETTWYNTLILGKIFSTKSCFFSNCKA